jgi:hypothetical protein
MIWAHLFCNEWFFVLKNWLVAHACNPSFLGDRDQEDRGS